MYANHEGKGSISNDYESTLRSRIWITGQINDGWKYTGMLQNTQDLSTDSGDESTDFQRAYLEGRLGGMDVTAGRYNAFFADGNIYDNRADGVEVSYGDKSRSLVPLVRQLTISISWAFPELPAAAMPAAL